MSHILLLLVRSLISKIFSSDYCLSFAQAFASTWLRSSYFKLYPFTYSILHFNFTFIFAIFASFIFFFFSFIVFNVSSTATIIGKCNEALETATSSSMPSIYFHDLKGVLFKLINIFIVTQMPSLSSGIFKANEMHVKIAYWITGSFHIWKQLYMTSHNSHIQNGRLKKLGWHNFRSTLDSWPQTQGHNRILLVCLRGYLRADALQEPRWFQHKSDTPRNVSSCMID